MTQNSNTVPNSIEWAKCNVCKTTIPFGGRYYKCSVSTCNRVKFQLNFCSVDCWDAHVPGQRHRNAYCTEQQAPRA